MNYFLYINNQQQGPYDERQFEQLLTTKSIPVDAFYWTEDMIEWRPLSEVLASRTRTSQYVETLKSVRLRSPFAVAVTCFFVFATVSGGYLFWRTHTKAITPHYAITSSPITPRETLQYDARDWAKGDVSVGVSAGIIEMRVLSNIELDSCAERRWSVYSATELSKLDLKNIDSTEAEEIWVAKYKATFISEFRPILNAYKKSHAPAF